MLTSIKRWLDKPFPYLEDFKLRLALSFLIGLVCFLTLVIFRPFGLHAVKSVNFIAGFGAISFLILISHLFLIPVIKKKWFDPNHWNIARQCLLITSILLFTGISNYVYNSTIGYNMSYQFSFATMMLMTVAVGVLPTLIMVYAYEVSARNRNLTASRLLPIPAHDIPPSSIKIQSESLKEGTLEMEASHLYYATSSNNYTEIVYNEKEEIKQKLLRLKLKNLEHQLSDNESFLRCHKSYIVNKTKIKGYHGNARSMVLYLEGIDLPIPISRSFDRSKLD